MKWEYLLFNAVTIAGPVLDSVIRRRAYQRLFWKKAVIAAVLGGLPFLIWDAFVTGSHWRFNPEYTLPFRLFHLPIEEILFFITVPVACLYIWIHLPSLTPEQNPEKPAAPVRKGLCPVMCLTLFLIAELALSAYFLSTGIQYTGLVLAAFSLTILTDIILKTRVLTQPKTLLYSTMIIFLTLIFNGYLTARPVVLYNPDVQLNLRIFTIPVEDFFYGLSLILLVTIFYTFLSEKTVPEEHS